MDALITELAGLLDLDATALSALSLSQDEDLPRRLAALRQEVADLRRNRLELRDFLQAIRQPLQLAEDALLPLITGRVLALSEQVGSGRAELSATRAELAALTAERTAQRRQALVDRGLQTGQLTPHLVRDWAGTVDLAVLSSFLETAPAVVPTGRQISPSVQRQAQPDAVLAAVARNCGIDPAKVRL